tara:strand:- start:305 stop:2728 length:2424 start_codon:yes stop_codon:yes gene_type:complete
MIVGIGGGVGFDQVKGIGGGGSGPVIPAIPTDSLVGHYLADQGISLTGTGITATVNQWDNQISSDHNLTQANGVAFEPTYIPISTVFGGRPMLYGNGDALNPTTQSDDFTLSTPGVFTYAFVFKTDNVERYIWDARGRGSGQTGGTAGYTENGIERTISGGWTAIGPGWNQAGYNGVIDGNRSASFGNNANLAPQTLNSATMPNLMSAGLEIWIMVIDGAKSYYSCNGRILGTSQFRPYSTTQTQASLADAWVKADKISPSIFSGYYGPNKGYGQGAMAELLVYDKALTMIEHNNLLENLSHKYKINYIKSIPLTEGDTLDADYVGFVRSPSGQVTVNAPNDIYLNGNNYNQYFGMAIKKGVDFTRPGSYEFKFGENPAGGLNPIFYPAFTFMSPNNAMMNQVYWVASNFPRLDQPGQNLRPNSYTYWAYNRDQGQAPGIMIRKNADTSYSAMMGAGNQPAYYRIKEWEVFAPAGSTPPFTVRIEWNGNPTWEGMKWFIDDVLFFDADETTYLTMPDATSDSVRAWKQMPLPSPGFPWTYGRIGRVYDQKQLTGSYINAPWNYEDFEIPTEGIVGHWDAGSGITLNGSDVASWEDKINGNVVSQSDPAKQPLFVPSGAMGGEPAVQFDITASQMLDSATNFVGSTDGNFTIITAFKPTYAGSGVVNMIPCSWASDSRAQGYWLLKSGGTSQTVSIQQSPPDTGTISSGYVNNTADYYTTGGVHSIMGSAGEAKRFYIRGNNREMIDANGSTGYSINTTEGFGIGAGRDNGLPFSGQIQEIIVYNRCLSLAELMEAEKNLMFKYKIFG